MRASVIVCTRNRSASVKETLEALSRLDCPDYEILVVDNSADAEKERPPKPPSGLVPDIFTNRGAD